MRPKGVRTPCAWCPKIPPGDPPSPESAQELTPQNSEAYAHYLECRATGRFPLDAICARNAAIIRSAEDDLARLDQMRAGLATVGGLLKRL